MQLLPVWFDEVSWFLGSFCCFLYVAEALFDLNNRQAYVGQVCEPMHWRVGARAPCDSGGEVIMWHTPGPCLLTQQDATLTDLSHHKGNMHDERSYTH
jgi:hypothetical protein